VREVAGGTDSATPAAAPSPDTTPATAVAAAAGDPTAGSTGGGADQAPSDGGDAPAPVTLAATPPAPALAPAAATVPAAPGAPAAQPPVAAQLSRPVAVLASRPDGVHTMTVVLTPENLGPVQVQVTVSNGSLDLSLAGAHEHGRAALLEALPDLRRDLQSAGLTLSRLDVSRDTSGSFTTQQQAAGQQWGQGSQQRGEARPAPWLRGTPDSPGADRPARTATSSSASTGVDVRV
jgi:flagellar hook-length control protein FliK